MISSSKALQYGTNTFKFQTTIRVQLRHRLSRSRDAERGKAHSVAGPAMSPPWKTLLGLAVVLHRPVMTLLTLPGETGVTSLYALADINGLMAGSKRGAVYCVDRQEEATGTSNLQLRELPLPLEGDDPVRTPNPYPIYCMTSNDSQNTLFCGGGDRYVTVWVRQDDGNWRQKQRLGPHTGWVKDVWYDSHNHVLNSIGCNCIETWKQRENNDNDDNQQGVWKHWKHCSIESSVSEAATLSSDLLCLCPAVAVGFFLAGGVDGRIHLWNSELGQPVASVAAHVGRVNAMILAPKCRLFFSGSHDGTIKCWLMDADANTLPRTAAATLSVEEDARVTAMTCIKDGSTNAVRVFFGTQNGLIGLALAKKAATGGVDFVLQRTVHLEGGPTIHALAVLSCTHDGKASNTPTTLAVGHSLGLTNLQINQRCFNVN